MSGLALAPDPSVQARRQRGILLAAVAAGSALAWLWLVTGHAAHGAAAGVLRAPHVHAVNLGGLALATSMWLVMMVAMMLPALVPWLLALGRLSRPAGGRGVALFAGGYFSVWLGYSLVGAGLQLTLQQQALLAADLRLTASLGGLVLVGAGLFQWTPLKAACLAHCRSPLSFFLTRWRDGPLGAFEMGWRHGLYCVGCCWALMAVSFAVGTMNLAWMAVLTVMLGVEKIAPGGARWSRGFGLALALWGLVLLGAGLGGMA